MFQTKRCREIRNTYSMFTFLCRKSCRLWDTWEKNVQPDRSQMTVRRMRIVCWINKATNTQSECVIRIAVSFQQWLHSRTSLLRYTYVAGLVLVQMGPTCASTSPCLSRQYRLLAWWWARDTVYSQYTSLELAARYFRGESVSFFHLLPYHFSNSRTDFARFSTLC